MHIRVVLLKDLLVNLEEARDSCVEAFKKTETPEKILYYQGKLTIYNLLIKEYKDTQIVFDGAHFFMFDKDNTRLTGTFKDHLKDLAWPIRKMRNNNSDKEVDHLLAGKSDALTKTFHFIQRYEKGTHV